ncbi:MAG: hypothetical protein GXP62_10570 [Oligoflexia bacterium]|nr:hypothetical protein [Oligoflexia bacterium]
MTTRRELLGHGCAAILLATLGAGPRSAEAAPGRTEPSRKPHRKYAPRNRCPHTGCRYHRPAHGGSCGFALAGAKVVLPDEPVPTDSITPTDPPAPPALETP